MRNAVTSQPTIENTTVTPVSTPEFKGEWVIHGNPTSKRIVYYIRGGGFSLMSPVSHRGITSAISKSVDAKVFAVLKISLPVINS